MDVKITTATSIGMLMHVALDHILSDSYDYTKEEGIWHILDNIRPTNKSEYYNKIKMELSSNMVTASDQETTLRILDVLKT